MGKSIGRYGKNQINGGLYSEIIYEGRLSSKPQLITGEYG
jgi:hypothetical protein